MERIKSNTFVLLIVFLFLLFGYTTITNAENLNEKSKEEKNTKFNLYTGMFDFSDDGKRSNLFGIEHQNEELFRNTFLGKLSPMLYSTAEKNYPTILDLTSEMKLD